MVTILDPTRAFASLNDCKTDVAPVLGDAEILEKVVASQVPILLDRDGIESLHDAARLYEVALAASYGQVCHGSIIGLGIQYQTLLDALRSASSTHLQTSMAALKYLKLAFSGLQNDEFDDAKALLVALPTLATRSEEVASHLLEQVSDVLHNVNARILEISAAAWDSYLVMRLAKQRSAPHPRGTTNLELTIRALGIFSAVLENVRDYCYRFEFCCQEIAKSDKLSKISLRCAATGILVDVMTKDWYEWLALAQANDTIVCGIHDNQSTMHRILSMSPNETQASERLEKLINDIESHR